MINQTHKIIIKSLKVLLIAATFGFIFYKLFYAYEIDELWYKFSQKTKNPSYLLLLTTLALMFLNWGIEIIKWKKLISLFELFDYKDAAKSILSGIALSIITPNQLGDFAGRVIHLRRFNKIKGSLVAIVGHTAQLLITLYAGTAGFTVLGFYLNWFQPNAKFLFVFSLILLLILIFWLYSQLSAFARLLLRIKLSDKIKNYLDVFTQYEKSKLLEIISWSFLRYVVFMFQYYFLLEFFGVNLPLTLSLAAICLVFLAQSVVPSFIFLDMGLRGVSAIWIMEKLSDNTIGILLSAYTLWMINMMLPAIIGLIIIYNTRLSDLE